jgi:alkanesulfonate monooxygenase SsuD/methylene tetrahydromethanopterin reductase-like flavin-dependent oxidoreductase (luciferase family)
MRYAVNVPNFEDYSDVRTVAALATDAEAAGWDGFFVWDHLAFVKALKLRIADPWVLLTGVALATERLRLGPMVTPLARRRPWKLARETVTLDRLSGGRLVLGVGLGEPPEDEYGSFGEPTDPVVRAARFEGSCPLKVDAIGELVVLDPDDVRELRAVIDGHRADPAAPFDIALGGSTPEDPAAARDMLAPLAEAGMTWWQESVDPRQTDLAAFRRRIRQGPPGA